MLIRNYVAGDETAQASVYNAAASKLPRFKAASAEEIARRYGSADSSADTKFYAVDGDEVHGYAVFDGNGRVGFPWCLPGSEAAREPLFDAVLSGLLRRGLGTAWAAYRSDWDPVGEFLENHGFQRDREILNFVAELATMPESRVPEGTAITTLTPADLPAMLALGEGVLATPSVADLEAFLWKNRYFGAESVFAVRRAGDDALAGFAILILNPAFADPTKLDAAMPCFRLGALGAETERHKRVNGMFSCVFQSDDDGEALLAEAVRRLRDAGVTHIAGQVDSRQKALCAFYNRFFERQGAFPVFTRSLAQE